MPELLVGIGGLLSDPACCVFREGKFGSAVEQLKVSRQDRPGTFPDEAFALALETAGVTADEIDCIAVARPFTMSAETSAQLELRSRFPRREIVIVEHHDSHAASAYYAS